MSQADVADAGFFEAHGLPIGIQIFPILPQLREDLSGTLKALAAMGYDMVETAGYADKDAAGFRAALDEAGLACGGMHVVGRPMFGNSNTLESNIEDVIAEAHVLGSKSVVIPLFFAPAGFTPDEDATPSEIIRAAAPLMKPDDYRAMADFMNEKGRRLNEEGIRLAYHSHNVEYAPLGDTFGVEIMLAETDPDVVDFQLELGWASAAGVDVPALLAAHPGRFKQMHVKDIAATTETNYAFAMDPAPLGEGVVDLETIIPIAYEHGTRMFFIEQEAPFPGDPIEAMAANARYIKALPA